MKNNLSYISLFSGAGIGCYGFKMEDFICISTVEILEKRIKIQKNNNKCIFDSGYICGDIRENNIKETLKSNIEKYFNKYGKKELDVLIATPPCQGMSVANHKKKDEKNRNSLVVESIKITKDFLPRFFIFENVSSFLNTLCTDINGIDMSIKESIEKNLSGNYNIFYKVINFKNYGSNSSRTRTLVIGVRKDLKNITPLDFFPDFKKEKNLFEVIGDLHSLKEMGEISPDDLYHQFKEYSPHMRSWIKSLKEGESAFDKMETMPHRIIDGEIVYNQQKNGDKYKRQFFDRVAPCIHTRNDILSSQNTIHPKDDRVFSIRELMRMMTIPNSFEWTEISFDILNNLSFDEKKKILKKEEMTIRNSIGEAVPTSIFNQIAKKIRKYCIKKYLSDKEIKELIDKEKLGDYKKLTKFIEKNHLKLDYYELLKIVELSNTKRIENSAYYTRQDICYSIVKNLPESKNFNEINILEPSVGIGAFLPLLIKKYEDLLKVNIDVIDIDGDSIDLLKKILKKIKIPKNININFITHDFLDFSFNKKYDIIIGNPPFGKVTNKEYLKKYRKNAINTKSDNIYTFFIEKSINLGKFISLIIPKSLLSSPIFKDTRKLLENFNFENIIDYGEKGFKGVKIETISIALNTNKFNKNNIVKIESYITNDVILKKQSYIFDNNFPTWLIYRNEFFDNVCEKLIFNNFTAFRDRQITNKIIKNNGKFRVLKSRNIISNGIKDIEGYDCYIDDITNLSISKYLNIDNLVLVPNLTYNPRATLLPKNTITDGSVAILISKNNKKMDKEILNYFNTEEFIKFYSIARNLGTRSLNIDNSSVFYFGIIK